MERATAAELTNLHIQGLFEGDHSLVMKAWRWELHLSGIHHKGCGKTEKEGRSGQAQEIYHD